MEAGNRLASKYKSKLLSSLLVWGEGPLYIVGEFWLKVQILFWGIYLDALTNSCNGSNYAVLAVCSNVGRKATATNQ